MQFSSHKMLTPQRGTCPARAHFLGPEPHFFREWGFCYFPSEPTVEEALSCAPAARIAVPSCWEMLGYGSHQYTNIKYPFPYDPPRIERDNPCGVYIAHYSRPRAAGKYYLNFEGVDSCFYLFVNGREAGYSSVPHSPSEFDVTNLLQDENELRVVVFKFSAGSYLEDQDKFRMSGVFRDVYMLRRPQGHLSDYTVRADYDADTGEGTLTVHADKPCTFSFYTDSGTVLRSPKKEREFRLILPVRPWSAESPVLYRLTVERAGEKFEERVGFRTVKAEGNVLTVNGRPVKFKGVNRHSMTEKGFVEEEEGLRRDLALMKKMNCNAIRTSHYPPHPLLPKLCDELGFYLIEEADVECHGVCSRRNFKDWEKYVNELADDPAWEEQFVSRALRMYERDKNRPSVIIWSLGNESGWGRNLAASARALRSKGDGRLIHYEGAWSNAAQTFCDGGLLDLYSRMYPEQAWLEEFAKTADRPLVMCEYTHAMGNSCGDIADYWKIIRAHASLAGGFIWEWCSHSILSEGKVLYGGDFGEYPHDGNFCMDGIVTTDRRPNPEYDQIKEIYAPLTAWREGNMLAVQNRYDFIAASEHCEEDGRAVSRQTLDIAGLPAGEIKRFAFSPPATQKYLYANVIFTRGEEEIARVQIPVAAEYFRTCAENNALSWELKGGMPSSLVLQGKELLRRPVFLSLYRAPTDNDAFIKEEWLDYGLDRAYFFPLSREGETVRGKLVTPYLDPIGEMSLSCREDNGLVLTADVSLAGHVASLPRFGFVFDLALEDPEVVWFGRGPGEAYCDRVEMSPVGLYRAPAHAMSYLYPKPQESGSRTDTRFVCIRAGERSLLIDSKEGFSFCVSPYLPADYKPHAHEMGPAEHTYLYIDYKMAGLGSNSCGPRIQDKYLPTERNFSFTFRLRSAEDAFGAHRS